MQPQFPIHSSPESVLILSHQKMLEDVMENHKAIMERLEQLPVILAEVRRTNGRVTKLEEVASDHMQRLSKLETEQIQNSQFETKIQQQVEAKAKDVESSIGQRMRQWEMIIGLLVALLVGYLGGLSMVVVGHLQQDVIRTPQDILEHLPRLK